MIIIMIMYFTDVLHPHFTRHLLVLGCWPILPVRILHTSVHPCPAQSAFEDSVRHTVLHTYTTYVSKEALYYYMPWPCNVMYFTPAYIIVNCKQMSNLLSFYILLTQPTLLNKLIQVA